MKFNTAILYDIENLMGGYGKAGYLSDLSLKDIFDEIMKKDISGVAIQRAYANWSDPRLSVLRGDIIELGIEPIQMFGFGRGPQKNASDIQLAIDAIDIAFTKNAVDNFVIVSGDGGFSSLAKKLHEYGKMVIGCAYIKTTNRVFEAVCDDFVWIELPTEESPNKTYKSNVSDSFLSNPILSEFAKEYSTLELSDNNDFYKSSKEIFNFLVKSKTTKNILVTSGINLGVYSQLLSYRIKDFDYFHLGFSRLVDFIRYVINDTKLKLVLKEPSDYRIIGINNNIPSYKLIENITIEPNVHSEEFYKQLLSRFNPRFPLPSPDIIYELAEYISLNKAEFVNLLYGDIVDKISTVFQFDQKSIRGTLTSFISAKCFIESEESKLDEKIYSFICASTVNTIELLKESIEIKLKDIVGEVNDTELSKLIPIIEN
ncbi:MAG: NYN domain-containing protein [Thiomargarita sp.]|nr:NYN domain-containing protein [Thiomargarita sp.]